MKKILLLTSCLLGTLVAADPISLTDTNPTTTLAAATPVIDALVSFSPSPSTSTPSTLSISHLEGLSTSKAYEADFTGWPRERLDDSIAFAQLRKQFPELAGKIWNTALQESQTLSTAAMDVDYLTSFDGSNSKKRKIGKEEVDAAPLPKKPKIQEDYPFNLPKDLLSLTLEYLETSNLLAFDYPPLRPFVKTLYMHGELVDRCACLQNFPNLTKLSLIDGRELDEEDVLFAERYDKDLDAYYVWDLTVLEGCTELQDLCLDMDFLASSCNSLYVDPDYCELVLNPISNLPKLKRISLRNRSIFGYFPSSIEEISWQQCGQSNLDFSDLINLKKLDLSYSCFNFESLTSLEGLGLKSLNLSHIFPFWQLSELQDLTRYISKCTSLEELDLSVSLDKTKLEDRDQFRRLPLDQPLDLSVLGNLGELRTLNLSGRSKIKDVSALGNVHTLNLTGCTGIPEEQITKLRKTVKHLILPDGTEHHI